ncbi:MAG: S41 family peptidase [Bacillota bacterium]
MKFRLRTVLYIVAAVIAVAALSSVITAKIISARRGGVVELSAEEYDRLNQFRGLDEMIESIDQKYYGTVPDRDALIKAAAHGILEALGDPYSAYYTNEEYEQYLKRFNGEYVGIGAMVGQVGEEGSKILDVYEDSPASAAGVKVGDVITEVDGKSIAGISLEDLSVRLSGPEGTVISLTVQRGGQLLSFDLKLAKINVRRVHSKLLSERTGYIRIDMFSGGCAEEFKEAIRDLTDRKMRSLVIDLRNNPGGSLSAVVDVVDAILSEGAIVTVKGSGGEEEAYRAKQGGINVPLAILVNEHSASASEILAAAIKENGAGIIVGTKTYGKGVVQTTFQLSSNQAWLKLTTAAYYTPSGANIDRLGIEPDIRVDLADEYKNYSIAQLDQKDDAQLWAALDEVRAQADALDAA